MIARISGILESIEANVAVISPGTGAGLAGTSGASGGGGTGGLAGFDVALEILMPAYLAVQLAPSVGQRVTFHTLTYLEGQGQGTSFIPRVIGFSSPRERDFFELFTTVKGIGNRRALRALAEQPGRIAGAVVRGDAKALTQLPEVGKRLAETIIAELKGKIDIYADLEETAKGSGISPRPSSIPASTFSSAEEEAIVALMNLGQTRQEAERNIARVVAREPSRARDVDAMIRAVFASSHG